MRPWIWFVLLLASCGNQPEAAKADLAAEPVAPTAAAEAQPAENGGTYPVMVYFRHTQLDGLLPLQLEFVPHPKMTEQVKQVIDLLSIDPGHEEAETIWPGLTYVREVYLIRDGTIVVDFDEGFINSLSLGATIEEYMVSSLVNTLLDNFQPYQRVRILVGGHVKETLLGHIDIEFPLARQNHLYTIVPEETAGDGIVVEDLGTKPEPDGDSQPPTTPDI